MIPILEIGSRIFYNLNIFYRTLTGTVQMDIHFGYNDTIFFRKNGEHRKFKKFKTKSPLKCFTVTKSASNSAFNYAAFLFPY
jgi:hypothetical protein